MQDRHSIERGLDLLPRHRLSPSLRLATGAVAAIGLCLGHSSPAEAGGVIVLAEDTEGATHIGAATGNGALTVALAPTGEVSVLSWPSPSGPDQLAYETAAGPGARELPHFGAEPSDGLFSGVLLQLDDGTESFRWLRDDSWEIIQHHPDPASGVLLTEHRSVDLSLSVDETVLVHPDSDVLVRRTTIRRADASPVVSLRYLLYEDLAPTTTERRDLALPLTGGLDDGADFAAWWDANADAVVHFAPAAELADLSLLDELMGGDHSDLATWSSEGLPLLEGLVDAEFGDGVFAMIGGSEPVSAFTVGGPAGPCDGAGGWSWQPEAAFDDALDDGELHGSPLAACDASAALAWDIELGDVGSFADASIDTFVALAASRLDARRLLDDARREGADRALVRVADEDAALTGTIASTDDDALDALLRRTRIALHQATDSTTGALVASFAVQPALQYERPLDSAASDLALALLGDTDAARSRAAHAVGLQLTEELWTSGDSPALIAPEGAWLAAYRSDGSVADSRNALALDRVAAQLLTLYGGAVSASSDDARRDALAGAWPALRRGANLLSGCVNSAHPALVTLPPVEAGPPWLSLVRALDAGEAPAPGVGEEAMDDLQWGAIRTCASSENGGPEAAGLHSAMAARAGLLAAVQAANQLCVDNDVVAWWQARADELAVAALQVWWSEGSQSWLETSDFLGWPSPLAVAEHHGHYFSDSGDADVDRAAVLALESQALASWAAATLEEAEAASLLAVPASTGQPRSLLALARWVDGRGDGKLGPRLRATVRRFAVSLPHEGTLATGPVLVSVDDDDDGVNDRAEARDGQPHVGEASRLALAVLASWRGDLFASLEANDLEPVCPTGVEPSERREAVSCGADCQESVAGSAPARRGSGSLVAFVLVTLGLRRRSRQRG